MNGNGMGYGFPLVPKLHFGTHLSAKLSFIPPSSLLRVLWTNSFFWNPKLTPGATSHSGKRQQAAALHKGGSFCFR